MHKQAIKIVLWDIKAKKLYSLLISRNRQDRSDTQLWVHMQYFSFLGLVSDEFFLKHISPSYFLFSNKLEGYITKDLCLLNDTVPTYH